MKGDYIRFNTKAGLQYVCSSEEYQRMLEAMGGLSGWISLRSAAGEEQAMFIKASEIEAFWLSTPEDREKFEEWSNEDTHPWDR